MASRSSKGLVYPKVVFCGQSPSPAFPNLKKYRSVSPLNLFSSIQVDGECFYRMDLRKPHLHWFSWDPIVRFGTAIFVILINEATCHAEQLVRTFTKELLITYCSSLLNCLS